MHKTNIIYLYDNTFINLLTLITLLINKHIIPFNIKNEEYSPSLIDETINLRLNNRNELIEQFINKLGINIFNTIYYVFLSANGNKELLIYYFILSSLKYKNKIPSFSCEEEGIFVVPARIELASKEPESFILSIELRVRDWTANLDNF